MRRVNRLLLRVLAKIYDYFLLDLVFLNIDGPAVAVKYGKISPLSLAIVSIASPLSDGFFSQLIT